MTTKLSGILQFLSFLVCVFLVGCGTAHPPVAKVNGKVTYNGQQAIGGRILFLPVGGGKQGIGTIRSDGTFELGTFAKNDGALVGNHQAMIVRAVFDKARDESLAFRRSEGQWIVVEPETVNEFVIELSSGDWAALAN